MRRLLLSALVIAVVLPAAVSARGGANGYPGSVVVLGHSGATGFGSDPKHSFRDAPENSWATGTNTAVKSVYSRILALNPAVAGHGVNLAEDGATLSEFAVQVRQAIALKPKPELVLVQIMDNDVKCDGQDAGRYSEFNDGFAAALETLTNGLPKARVFVISSAGSISSYVKTMQAMRVGARLMHAGKGPCSIFAPVSDSSPGRVVPEHVAYLRRTIRGYEAQLAAACATFPRCRYDGGAASRLVITAADLSPRFDHLSIAGNAKLAAIEWSAIRRLHVVPG